MIGPLLAELLLLLTLRQRTVIIHVLRDCKQEHQSAVVSAVKITHSRPDVLFGGAEAGLNNGVVLAEVQPQIIFGFFQHISVRHNPSYQAVSVACTKALGSLATISRRTMPRNMVMSCSKALNDPAAAVLELMIWSF